MALSCGAPLRSSTMGIFTRARKCYLFGTKEALSQSEKNVVMSQGASPVFAKAWPLSPSPVGTSMHSPHTPPPYCILHMCTGSAHFTDEGIGPDMVTEVPKGAQGANLINPDPPPSSYWLGQIPLPPSCSLGLPSLNSEVGALGTTTSVDPCSLSVWSRLPLLDAALPGVNAASETSRG